MLPFLVVLGILMVVVYIVTGPLRAEPPATVQPPELNELEAARDAKYREIRDAELDRATGKLSDADFHAIDGRLRADALEILDRIESLALGGGDLPADRS